jgi:hypothetical protein
LPGRRNSAATVAKPAGRKSEEQPDIGLRPSRVALAVAVPLQLDEIAGKMTVAFLSSIRFGEFETSTGLAIQAIDATAEIGGSVAFESPSSGEDGGKFYGEILNGEGCTAFEVYDERVMNL